MVLAALHVALFFGGHPIVQTVLWEVPYEGRCIEICRIYFPAHYFRFHRMFGLRNKHRIGMHERYRLSEPPQGNGKMKEKQNIGDFRGQNIDGPIVAGKKMGQLFPKLTGKIRHSAGIIRIWTSKKDTEIGSVEDFKARRVIFYEGDDKAVARLHFSGDRFFYIETKKKEELRLFFQEIEKILERDVVSFKELKFIKSDEKYMKSQVVDLEKEKNILALIVVMIFVVALGYHVYEVNNSPSASERKSNRSNMVSDKSVSTYVDPRLIMKGRKPLQSPWDGAVPCVVNYLKANLNDADSYEGIDWSEIGERGDHWVVRHKYRAANAFGAKIIQNQLFHFQNPNGDVDCKMLSVQDYP